jgi:uncharacterized protein YciI
VALKALRRLARAIAARDNPVDLAYSPRDAPSEAGPRSATEAAMAEWIYFIHADRDDFAATITDAERAVWAEHFERLKRLLADGTLIMAGPTLGRINTGIAVIEAPDEATAREIMEQDPTILSGFAQGELRGFKVSLLRGRDERSVD